MCKKKKERYIDISAASHKDIIFIRIKNSISEKPIWQEGKLISKKGQNHGIGLKNVEKVLAEYNGSIDFEINDEEFICNIILNK